MLIVVCGLPGTGKSTIARYLSKKLDAIILSTDRIRKLIIRKPVYSEKEKEFVYEVMFLIADFLLKNNFKCILDGVFHKRKLRERAESLAYKYGKKFILIECTAEESVIKQRLSKARKFSEADFEVYKKLKEIFEPIQQEHIKVNTSRALDEIIEEIINQLKKS